MVRLQTHLTDGEIIQRTAQVGVGMMSAQPSYLNRNCAGEFIFGYSELTQEQIQRGISRLALAIAK